VADLRPRRSVWPVVYWLLAIANIVPVWWFRHFPSQDGPAHLHNAYVIAHEANPFFHDYYQIRMWQPAGNLFSELCLAGLMFVVDPLLAQKVLLSAYYLLFFGAFAYVFKVIRSTTSGFAMFVALLAPNWLLFMGFWNFCFGVVSGLVLIGCYAQHRHGPNLVRYITIAIVSLVTYSCHLLMWIVVIVTILAFELASRRLGRPGLSNRAQATTAICIAWPVTFLLIYVVEGGSGNGLRWTSDWHTSLWYVYSLSFLQPLRVEFPIVFKFVAVSLAGFAVIAAARFRPAVSPFTISFLTLAAIGLVVAVFGPDSVGSGTFVRQRFAFIALVALYIAMFSLAEGARRWIGNAFGGFVALLAVTLVLLMISPWRVWNARLSRFEAVGNVIDRNSTVLLVNVARFHDLVDPFRNAAGLLSQHDIIDLSNYEASTDHFLLMFDPEHSPFDSLGNVTDLTAVPPRFDIGRYLTERRGRVDYLVFHAPDDTPLGATIEMLFGAQVAAFTSIGSPSTNLRIYRYRH
jgi:hypothetical protein